MSEWERLGFEGSSHRPFDPKRYVAAIGSLGERTYQADKGEEEIGYGGAPRFCRRPYCDARPEDPDIDPRLDAGLPDGPFGLQLHSLVGIVELLADVAFVLEHPPRPASADVGGGHVSPGAKPTAPEHGE